MVESNTTADVGDGDFRGKYKCSLVGEGKCRTFVQSDNRAIVVVLGCFAGGGASSLFYIFTAGLTDSKKTNELAFNRSGVKRELLDTARSMPGARRRGRPRTAWMDNIKTWTGQPVEESTRMTEDRDKWRKYVHGVPNPRIEDG